MWESRLNPVEEEEERKRINFDTYATSLSSSSSSAPPFPSLFKDYLQLRREQDKVFAEAITEDAYHLLNKSHFREAVADFSRAIDLHQSPNTRALLGRARAYEMLGNFAGCTADYNSVLAIDGSNEEANAYFAALEAKNRSSLTKQRGHDEAESEEEYARDKKRKRDKSSKRKKEKKRSKHS